MLMMVSMMGCNNKHSVKKYKFVRELNTGENVCSKRMRISRVPCEIPWKKIFLIERKDTTYKWFRAVKYIHYYFDDSIITMSQLI